WLATEDGVVRIGPDGSLRRFAFRPPHAAFGVFGVAPAPDGSVWFTLGGIDHHTWIVRMTSTGVFVRRPVPRSVGAPGAIAAAPHGWAWFTGRHVLARIAPAGKITSVRLGGEAAPHDVLPGADGALWFASDACLGRVDSAGAMTTWPVAGAQRLEELAE